MEAPELLASLEGENVDTYFEKQPITADEIAHACMALRVCCVAALRYGGRDRAIIRQLNNNPEYCDYVIAADGELVLAVDEEGDLLPFAKDMSNRHRAAIQLASRKHCKKWWQFWRR